MSDKKAFNIDLGRLKTREKDASQQTLAKTDRAGEELGFLPREPLNAVAGNLAPVQAKSMRKSFQKLRMKFLPKLKDVAYNKVF